MEVVMKIKPHVRKNNSKLLGVIFTGYITVKASSGKYLYSCSSKVKRLTKEEAKLDACALMAEMREQ